MPRNGSGTYALPSGNPVTSGTTISATTHNATNTDIATALTDSIDKDGQTVITGAIDHNGNEIILDVDGDTSIHASTDDQIDIKVAGADDFRITANTLTALSGSSVVVPDGGLTFGSTAISSTAAELNKLDGATVTTAEINYNDLATLGTTAASKVFTADANGLTKVSGAVLNTEDTLTDQATIAWDVIASPVAKVTLAGNRTLAAPSGTTPAAGQFVSLLIIQDGTGSRTITWNAVYEFASDTAPTLTTTANLGDIFIFRYNGSKWLEVGRNLALTLS